MKKFAILIALLFTTSFLYSSDLRIGIIAEYELQAFLNSRCEYLIENWQDSAYLSSTNYQKDYDKFSLTKDTDFKYEAKAAVVEILSSDYLGYSFEEYNYLLNRNSLDAIIFTKNFSFENILQFDIYIVDRASIKKVSSIISQATKLEEDITFVKDLADLFYPGSTLFDVSALPSLSTLMLDDEVVSIFRDNILVLNKSANIRVKCPGFLDYEGNLLDFASGKIEVDMVKFDYPPLAITTVPLNANLSIMSQDSAVLPYYIEDAEENLAFSLSSVGFASSSYQLNDFDEDLLSINLMPKYLDKEEVISSSRTAMYSSLRNFIISVALTSLSHFATDVAPLDSKIPYNVLNGVTIGLSFMSFIDFVKNTSTYYNSAKNIYL